MTIQFWSNNPGLLLNKNYIFDEVTNLKDNVNNYKKNNIFNTNTDIYTANNTYFSNSSERTKNIYYFKKLFTY